MSERLPPRVSRRSITRSTARSFSRGQRETVVTTKIELPIRTIALVLVTISVIWLLGRLWSLVLLFTIATLLSLAIEPWIDRGERRGWPRARAVALILIVIGAVILLTLGLLLDPLIEQAVTFTEDLPAYIEQVQSLIRANSDVVTWIQERIDSVASDPSAVVVNILSFGSGILSGVGNIVILAAMTVYLMMDGPRVFSWAIGPLQPHQQERAKRIRAEISRLVGGYIGGQLIVSLLFGLFTFVTLVIAGAPQPLLIAFLAALLDAIPLVGATIATVPAVLVALTVSFPTGMVILGLFVVYQQVENYLIAPRVFRGALQIYSLVVLIAVLVGSTLLGIVGALLALPVAAAIPAVARVWHDDRSPSTGPTPRPDPDRD